MVILTSFEEVLLFGHVCKYLYKKVFKPEQKEIY